jgi:hypothetical protein
VFILLNAVCIHHRFCFCTLVVIDFHVFSCFDFGSGRFADVAILYYSLLYYERYNAVAVLK